ncbi:MAG TPA: ATPase, T2SS/T4P/T4SS family [Candidatus Ozemobacteraceae bacterium]|nr:ATPase, T2SS/T4P/T4SS family [Candidatus Ozemobacteraceae bacterium]
MANAGPRAEVFVFTSFQGGIGKSSTALRFSRALRQRSGRNVAFIECNWFAPSAIVAKYDLAESSGMSFMEYFKSDWTGLTPENVAEKFSERDGLWLMPFTGIRPNEPLGAGFIVNEADLGPAMDRLLRCLSQRNAYAVIDLTLFMTPFPQAVLLASDVIYYLYAAQDGSPELAKRFLIEVGKWPNFTNRVIMVRNMVDTETEDTESKLHAREFLLPMGSAVESAAGDKHLDEAIAKLAEKAMENQAAERIRPDEQEVVPPVDEVLVEYQRSIRSEIISTLEKRFGMTDQELRKKVEHNIELSFKRNPPPQIENRNVYAELKKALLDDILGLGPLEDFIRDPDVDEIMVNGPSKIFIEKRGKLQLSGKSFSNTDQVKTVIDRILMPIGRTVNERNPFVDARLADGSRVHAIIPPLSLTGPMLTIRKFSSTPYSLDDLVFRFKAFTPSVAEFLKLCVKMRRNIIVSGGASSGKTTLLNVLSMNTQPDERVICIEDSAELRLAQENLGRLEARQQAGEAKTQVTIRDLVRNALRMRPDRIIVGECRGEEALDMLQAMNTGHEGSLTTLHANSSRDALARLETMVLMAGVDLPLRAVREQIASAVNIVIQTARLSDGTRRVIEISEVVGMQDVSIQLETIFKFDKKWIGEDGRVFGEMLPTGYVPLFIRECPGRLIERVGGLFKIEK